MISGAEIDSIYLLLKNIFGLKDVLYLKARKMDYFTSSALHLQP